jgi:predicted KAP-like P-loop ATPase
MSIRYRAEILKSLSLYADEPDRTSTLFHFKRFAEQLAGLLLDEHIPTPYSIALHGDWGGGKTSLLQQAYDIVIDKISSEKWKIIWFNAWEYENVDPMLALMETIASEYSKRTNSKIKRIIKGLILTSFDVVLRSQLNTQIKEIEKNFAGVVNDIPTIKDELEKMIGRNGRLVVFIDDLDRCSIENILKILEAVKLFFSAKGAIFVFGLDTKKVERAWELRYGKTTTSLQEGKDHIDKIFQLRLALPPKEKMEIKSYINKLARTIPDETATNFIIKGCPANPRKIKRILNLLYFLARDTNALEFDNYFI